VLKGSVAISLVFGVLAAINGDAARAREAYIAPSGSDTGSCPLSNPCLTIPYAATKGSTVVLLESFDTMAPLQLNDSISIVGRPGAFVEIPGGVLTIGNGTSFPNVTIDGLTIGAAQVGVNVRSAGIVTIRNCVFKDNYLEAIGSLDNVLSSPHLHVENTTIQNAWIGVYVAGGTQATIDNSKLLDIHNIGVYVTQSNIAASSTVASAAAVIRNSIISGLGQSGTGAGVRAYATGPGSAAADVEVTGTTISYFNIGLNSEYGSGPGLTNVTVTNSTVTQNCTGFVQTGGTFSGGAPGSYFNSFGNNALRDNGVGCLGGDTSGSITSVNSQ